MSRALRAISRALPQELRLIREISSGAIPASAVHELAGAQAALQAEGDLRLHVGELELDQLVGRQGPAELTALERVIPRRVPAGLGGAEHTPGDAVACVVEAAEGAP
jgi:hypothetical protein